MLSNGSNLHSTASNSNSLPMRSRGQFNRRQAGPKARTGCITCKIRRVKCDEGKPTCLRCLKFGTVCDGYAPKVTSPVDRRVVKTILPKAAVLNSIPKVPPQRRFTNDQEYSYFNLFSQRTAVSLAGYFRGQLWNRTILQASEDMPSIRHAIVALGALDKTMEITQHMKDQVLYNSQTKSHESEVHHQFALNHYGKAITQIRRSLSAKKQDYRSAVISCLLTICFEALNGDMQSALEQIRNGLHLIEEWRALSNRTPGFVLSPELQSIGNYELIQAFGYLDNNSIMIMNAQPIGSISETESDNEDATRRTSEAFTSLEQARSHLEVLVNRMLHWVASAYAWGALENDEARQRVQPSPAIGDKKPKPNDYQHVLLEQREKYIKEFRSWRVAFQPLWIDAQSADSHNSFMSALTIELRFKSIFTSCLLGNHFTGDMAYDNLTAEFREILVLARLFMKCEKFDSPSRRAVFTLDDPFISAVYIVILKCRDPILRREAIEILESHPRRDGVMDTKLMARIGAIQMNIEEAGLAGDHMYIPEHARIRGIKTTTDMFKRTGRMKYLKMVSASNRKFVVHHLNFTW